MKPEILSPAGSPESLDAALRAGADAVYFGVGRFNARQNAENFDRDSLAAAVQKAHRQNTRVYIAMNTLLSDQELPEALSLVKLLCREGIDGVIVQDLGLASLIRQAALSLRLHASTQMSLHSPAALPIVKELGFCRVVAAREMSFPELKEFCRQARHFDIETEVFVHGALCMSLSGQCYLSAVLGGRSGNRGRCAQPCRLPFRAGENTGYDLSLKDVSLTGHIEKLSAIGVASLKIEGRMKRPEYVAAATAVCRSALDFGKVEQPLSRSLEGVFSRSGFTSGYFDSTLGPDMFGTRTKEDVTLTAGSLSSLHTLYRTERQCVELTASFAVQEDSGVFSLSDGEHSVRSSAVLQDSDRDLSAEFVREKLSRLGGTPYKIKSFSVESVPHKYISAAALGALRQQALERLDHLRTAPVPHTYIQSEVMLPPRSAPQTQKYIARFDSYRQIPETLEGIYALVLPLEEACRPLSLPETPQKWVEIPRCLFAEEPLRRQLRLAREQGFTAALCGNLAAVTLAKEAGFKAVGDFGLGLYNSHSIKTAAGLGIAASFLSFELTLGQIGRLSSGIPIGSIVYGRLPLMLTRNCPVKNSMDCAACGKKSGLYDRKGVFFPVRCRNGCSEMYNSVPLWMADRMVELSSLDMCMLYFTVEDAAECAAVLEAYRRKTPPADGGFTRGLFYRGVE